MNNSPLAYIGGKSRLSKQIIDLIPRHKTYCEAFAGGAWVFFRKRPSEVEVINDLDSDLIAFYRVVQSHLEEFLKQFKWLLTSREIFDDWKNQLDSRGLTDIQRAARYYYIQRLAYGGRVRNRSFGVEIDGRVPRINLIRLEEEMSDVHLRLAHVRIENLSWQEFLQRYDRPDTFFFCDPPYYRCPDYKHNMGIGDYEDLARILATIKGKFILTINDRSEMRKIFRRFDMKPISLLYSVSQAPTTGEELIIYNFEPEQREPLLFPDPKP